MPKLRNSLPPDAEESELSVNDCDALLEFPYQDYVDEIKQEKYDSDLPPLGTSASLVLNPDNDFTDDDVGENDTDPKALDACLSLNKALQQKAIETMNRLHIALSKNKIKQDEIHKILKAEERNRTLGEAKTRITKPIQLFAAPYFRDVRGMMPPDNEDTISKIKMDDVTAYLQPPKPWTMAEKDRLMHGVAANALSYVLKPYKTKRDFLKCKMKDKNLLEFEISVLKKQILRIERKIKMECEKSYKELIEQAKGNIDWMTIAATNMEGSRSEEECEMMWNNYLSVFINKEPFSADEDAQLKMLVQKYNGRDWDSIAEDLETKRSAIQCFERYQTKLNKELVKKYWTPEEDERLIKLVESFRVGKFIPWNKVCNHMEGRARFQIINRYERTLSTDIQRCPWTKEEDAMLLACVGKFGYKWTRMKEYFPGRFSYSVRERYINHLDPTLRIGDWSKAEDMRLIECIRKYGYGRWAKIASDLPGRTDNMCFSRARRLAIHSLPEDKDDKAYDPVKLSKMLKPIAPSKNCLSQNCKLRELQNAAQDTLQSALEKIAPSLEETIDLVNVDLPSVSVNTIRALHKELCHSENRNESSTWTPKYVVLNGKAKPRIVVKKRQSKPKDKDYLFDQSSHKDIVRDRQSSRKDCIFNEEGSEEDTYSGDNLKEEFEACVEPEFDLNEKLWLQSVLETKLKEQASFLLSVRGSPRTLSLNVKESAECSIYETFLQQELLCSKLLDDDEVDDFIFSGVNYNASLANVVHYFVQPPVPEDEIIVLSPNCCTLDGMDMINFTENRLRRTANFLDHSTPYVLYLTEYSRELPMCVKCCNQKQVQPPPRSTFDVVVNSMKSSMLVVDERMRKAAMCETRYSDNPEEQCLCKVLANSKADVTLLIRRVVSLCLWPYLLSSTDLQEEQEELLKINAPVKYHASHANKASGRRMSKKKEKKPTVSTKTVVNGDNLARPKKIRKTSTPRVSTSVTPRRRSSRKCVTQRKSFAYAVKDEEQ